VTTKVSVIAILSGGKISFRMCACALYLDQNIGLNRHKRSLLVNSNTVECNVSQEKN